jgi:RNA polymerase sigma factor (sigma-70 family)
VPASSRNESFEAVVLPHLGDAYNLARWLMHDSGAGEDVLQDAMVRALTYFPSFKGTNPRAWLLQIVRNTAYTSMKRNRGIELVPIASDEADGPDPIASDEADGPDPIASNAEGSTDAIADLPSADDDPEASLIKARDQLHVQQLIAALPVELRETLVLRELEELSYKKIAEVTRTPIGTVMSRLWRARQILLQMLLRAEAAKTEPDQASCPPACPRITRRSARKDPPARK